MTWQHSSLGTDCYQGPPRPSVVLTSVDTAKSHWLGEAHQLRANDSQPYLLSR